MEHWDSSTTAECVTVTKHSFGQFVYNSQEVMSSEATLNYTQC